MGEVLRQASSRDCLDIITNSENHSKERVKFKFVRDAITGE